MAQFDHVDESQVATHSMTPAPGGAPSVRSARTRRRLASQQQCEMDASAVDVGKVVGGAGVLVLEVLQELDEQYQLTERLLEFGKSTWARVNEARRRRSREPGLVPTSDPGVEDSVWKAEDVELHVDTTRKVFMDFD